jgi:hypothetical protein
LVQQLAQFSIGCVLAQVLTDDITVIVYSSDGVLHGIDGNTGVAVDDVEAPVVGGMCMSLCVGLC